MKDDAVRLYLFCLMSNHFHLAIETPQGNLSHFIQRLTTGYSVYDNLRFGVEEAVLKQPRRQSPVKPVVARCLVRYGGQTQREVAARLGLRPGAAVSAQLKRLQDREGRDRKLRRQVLRGESTLEPLQTGREKGVKGRKP